MLSEVGLQLLAVANHHFRQSCLRCLRLRSDRQRERRVSRVRRAGQSRLASDMIPTTSLPSCSHHGRMVAMARLRRRWRLVKWVGLMLCVVLGAAWGISTQREWYTYRAYLHRSSSERTSEVYIPIWMPFLLTAVPTAIIFWRDRRRIPAHCCQGCGYDLTGNTSGVCPECGVQP